MRLSLRLQPPRSSSVAWVPVGVLTLAALLAGCETPGSGSGYVPQDISTSPSTCTNGSLDPGEVDVDCGGPCEACAVGKACEGDADCASGLCAFRVCRDAACGNGAQDPGEVDVDCGGPCPACEGDACAEDVDCATGYCASGLCAVASCSDGISNGGESDVDCGGDACPPCPDGLACRAQGDCAGGACHDGVCATATCDDGARDGQESDVDCGGTCPGCALGAHCGEDADCLSARCEGGVCAEVPPTCDDGARNGNESDVDCGGTCPGCGYGQACATPADCASGLCEEGACAEPSSCSDNERNGDETDVDCGGSCKGCALGQLCDEHADCLSATCIFGVCAMPSCDDELKNQKETDVDCGGECPGCADGRACLIPEDCASGRCTNGVCTSCEDQEHNADETDVDCGGSCGPCAVGATCGGDGDCSSGLCCGTVCVSPDDPAHCGSCTACPTSPNGTATCQGGVCGLECQAGYHRCGDACLSDAAVESCGDACSPCPSAPHGTAVCEAGACGLSCDAGYHLCGGSCVADDSVAHCGSSCDPCPGDPHGEATCVGGACGLSCDAGYHACGAACVSDTSIDHCGASCTPCAEPGPNASVSCSAAGECVYLCQAGSMPCGTECLAFDELSAALQETTIDTPDYTEAGERIVAEADGGMLIAGYAGPTDVGGVRYGETEGWLLKLNPDGSTAWEATLPPMSGWNGLALFDAYRLPAGGWRLAGQLVNDVNDTKGWVGEVDAAGALVWQAEVAGAVAVWTLFPVSASDSVGVGETGYSDSVWYGRFGAGGVSVWADSMSASFGRPTGALVAGGVAVAGRTSAGGTILRRVGLDGQPNATDLTATGMITSALVALPTGGAVMVGRDASMAYKPAVVTVSGAWQSQSAQQPAYTGAWTAGDARPGGGLVLGGVRDYAYGWNPLSFALSQADGQIAWEATRYNTSALELYNVRMTDARTLPSGGYAWLAQTDEAYGNDFQATRLFQIQCSGSPTPPSTGGLVISELLYDAVGADSDVFVELHGPPGKDISGYTIVGVNGNGGSDYKTVTLSGALGGDGLYVVGNTSAGAWIADQADQLASVDFQNGPDSVQLRDPAGVVVDALAYGSFGASDVFAGEGSPAAATSPGESLSRDTKATDTDNNANDFSVQPSPTPGAL